MVTTSERLAVMETKVTDMSTKLDDHIMEQRCDFDKLINKFDALENKMDTKFAGKWVEKLSLGLLMALFTAIGTFIFMNI